MKKIITVICAALFVFPLFAQANCPAIEKIYCSRTVGGLSCGSDYPGWVGGALTSGTDSTVKKFMMVTWYRVGHNEASVRCLYSGDKNGVIVLHEGNFGAVSVPTPKPFFWLIWKKGYRIIDGNGYPTLTCAAGINVCEFKYTG